ncbi:hypothetical protein [Brevibacillus sp. SYSU BS000544]
MDRTLTVLEALFLLRPAEVGRIAGAPEDGFTFGTMRNKNSTANGAYIN